MYQSPELDKIRKRIDALDNEVHDLLMERADLVMTISAEKKKQGIQIVQPAREARMIRRLMARHRQPLPEEAIVRIWRELVSCVSLLQTGLSVAVYLTSDTPEYWDMARDYFGSVLPMQKDDSTHGAIQKVINHEVTFAVLPWPEKFDENSWWTVLMKEKNSSLSILQRLPYGDKGHYDYHKHPALIVANAGFDTSDDDCTFIGVILEEDIEAGFVISQAQIRGMKIVNHYQSNVGTKSALLLEIDKFLSEDRQEYIDFKSSLGINYVRILGGYPSPLVYHTSKKGAQ